MTANYLRHRALTLLSFLTALILLIMMTILPSSSEADAAPRRVGQGADTPTPAVGQMMSMVYNDLKLALESSADFPSFVRTLAELMSWGGIGVWDGNTVYWEPKGRAGLYITPEELFQIALDERSAYPWLEINPLLTLNPDDPWFYDNAERWSVAEIAEMLRQADFPFEDGLTPGEQLHNLLMTWAFQSENPEFAYSIDPMTFGAQVIWGEARRGRGYFHRTAPSSPEDHYLTRLEVYILLAEFGRFSGAPPVGPADSAQAGKSEGVLARAQQSPVCERLKSLLELEPKPADEQPDIPKAMLENFVDEAGQFAKSPIPNYASKVLGAIGKFKTAVRLTTWLSGAAPTYAYLYTLPTTGTTANQVVKPYPGAPEWMVVPNVDVVVMAGISEPDRQALKEFRDELTASSPEPDLTDAFLDCVGEGIRQVTASQIPQWRVEWRIFGKPEHVLYGRDNVFDASQGQFEQFLKRQDDTTGTQQLGLDIIPGEVGPDQGHMLEDYVTVRARVYSNVVPDFSQIDLPGGLVEYLTGLYDEFTPMVADHEFKVVFFDPCEWELPPMRTPRPDLPQAYIGGGFASMETPTGTPTPWPSCNQ